MKSMRLPMSVLFAFAASAQEMGDELATLEFIEDDAHFKLHVVDSPDCWAILLMKMDEDPLQVHTSHLGGVA